MKGFQLWSKPQLHWLHLVLPLLTEVKEAEAGTVPGLPSRKGPGAGERPTVLVRRRNGEKAPEPEATGAVASIMAFSQDYKIKLTENLSTSQQASSVWKCFEPYRFEL